MKRPKKHDRNKPIFASYRLNDQWFTLGLVVQDLRVVNDDPLWAILEARDERDTATLVGMAGDASVHQKHAWSAWVQVAHAIIDRDIQNQIDRGLL